jgi:hypothetical protein
MSAAGHLRVEIGPRASRLNQGNAVMEVHAMRALIVVLIALFVTPAITLGGPHLKKLHDLHAAHAHKHKMKKAMHKAQKPPKQHHLHGKKGG